MGTRRRARERALQLLFQSDIHGGRGDWVERFWEHFPVPEDVRAFADLVLSGVLAHRAELDAVIDRAATHWRVERMAVVDRNILRAALFELLWMPDIPAKVSVNEALELARLFADEEARRFINGILDRVLREDPRLEAKRAELAETPGEGR